MKLPKKQRDTNPSILRHFLTVLSATVFLALFLLLYNVFQWSALQTITSYNNDFVESVNTLSASLLNNIKNSAMQMFYTSSIKTLRTSQSLSNSQRILAIRDLGNFVSSSDFLDSVMIYNSSLDMIYTSEGNYAPSSPSAFYDKEAASILTHPESHPYLTPIRRQLKGNDVYSFLFFEYHNAASSSLLVNVDADWYNAHLLGLAGNSNYMVIDADGTVIAAADHSLDLFLEESWPDIRTTLAENPTEGFLMPSIFSSAPGWMYHRVVNSSWYYLRPIDLDTAVPGLMFIRNLLFTLFLIMSSILAVLAPYLLKLFLPLHSIRDAQRLNRLYEGNLPAGFAFPVLLLHTGAESAPDLKSVLKPIRTPILAALLGDRAEAAVSCCSEAERKALSDAISQIPGGRFYIGELCHSPEDIKKSRSALLELEQLHMLYPDRPVLEEALLASCNPVSSLNTRDVTALTAALQAGQIDAAQSQWNQIFSRIRNDRYWDFCFSIQYIGNQINHLIDEFQLGDHWDASQFLNQLTDIQDLHTEMGSLCQRITSAAIQKKKAHLSDLAQQINDYIEQNYADPELSQQQIAAHFQMNAAYLSRQYQKSAELSLSDAIHRFRVRQACVLLADTEESVEFIAQKVGYNNIKYFFVLFKKWTGTTPKQYRLHSQ